MSESQNPEYVKGALRNCNDHCHGYCRDYSRTSHFVTLRPTLSKFPLQWLLLDQVYLHLAGHYEGWHSRTKAYPSPAAFTPATAALSLVVLRNSPVEPKGFTLALFDGADDKVTVDAMGRVLLVVDADYAGIVELARRVATELPDAGGFRNYVKETCVQGFVKGKTELKEPVRGLLELPDVLSEVVGLVLEGTLAVRGTLRWCRRPKIS
ncbi:hypothetical protein FB451DRAFT_1552379 [Mycena latifolia]|nr:hypothetical protein FB451DRAFT_1552379 [Mycena latifolia]